MKLKIAICDDDTAQRSYLNHIVSIWAQKNRHLTDINLYFKNAQKHN